MLFDDAMKEVYKGKNIRRKGNNSYYICIERDNVVMKYFNGVTTSYFHDREHIEDLLANDWEVFNLVWKPVVCDLYYYIVDNGSISACYYTEYDNDILRVEVGNCFKTREQAEDVVEKLRVIKQLQDYALANNKEAIDWNNSDQLKYTICYDHEAKRITNGLCSRVQSNPFNIYFTSRKIAQKAIKTIGEDRIKKYYFDC